MRVNRGTSIVRDYSGSPPSPSSSKLILSQGARFSTSSDGPNPEGMQPKASGLLKRPAQPQEHGLEDGGHRAVGDSPLLHSFPSQSRKQDIVLLRTIVFHSHDHQPLDELDSRQRILIKLSHTPIDTNKYLWVPMGLAPSSVWFNAFTSALALMAWQSPWMIFLGQLIPLKILRKF